MTTWVSSRLTTRSAGETFFVGCELGRALTASMMQPCFVVLLTGDLGAGKTCLTKGLAKGLGIPEDDVNSPTFTLVNEYHGHGFRLWHLDLYRLPAGSDVFETLGLNEMLEGPGCMVIEWSERLGRFRWHNGARIALAITGDDDREITIEMFESS